MSTFYLLGIRSALTLLDLQWSMVFGLVRELVLLTLGQLAKDLRVSNPQKKATLK